MLFFGKKIGVIFLCAGLLLSGGPGRCMKTASYGGAGGLAAERAGTAKEESAGENAPDWSMELPEKKLYSASCALMDGYSGRILYGKEQKTGRANASTTKIMTCILALENADWSDTAAISERAQRQPKVRMGVKAGEKYRLKDLLFGLMLESYNDCAVVIAEKVAGSVEKFADMMNKKAKELGCTHTYFITPNGLDEKDERGCHHTTAEDLCRIMRYCVWQSPACVQFLAITGRKSYSFVDEKKRSHTFVNHNLLLGGGEGVISGKTGFTAAAGYCYVCACKKGGKRFTAAFLACGWPNHRRYKWADARRLLEFGQKYFVKKNLMRLPEPQKVRVIGGYSGEADPDKWGEECFFLASAGQEQKELWYMISAKDRCRGRIICKKPEPPVDRGQKAGDYEILLNRKVIGRCPLFSDREIRRWTPGRLFFSLFRSFLMK